MLALDRYTLCAEHPREASEASLEEMAMFQHFGPKSSLKLKNRITNKTYLFFSVDGSKNVESVLGGVLYKQPWTGAQRD